MEYKTIEIWFWLSSIDCFKVTSWSQNLLLKCESRSRSLISSTVCAYNLYAHTSAEMRLQLWKKWYLYYVFLFVCFFFNFRLFLQSVHIIFTCIVASQLHVNSIYRYDMWRHTLVNKNQQLLYNVNWVSCLFLLIWFVTDWLQKCIGLIYLIYRKAIFIHKKRWSTLTNVQTV